MFDIQPIFGFLPLLLAALPYIALAASAAGAGASAYGQVKANKAVKKTVEAAIKEQERIRSASKEKFTSALPDKTAESANKVISEGAAERAADYEKNLAAKQIDISGTALPVAEGNSPIAKTDTEMLKKVSAAQAQLGGYPSWDIFNLRNNNLLNWQLMQNASDAQRRAAILPYSMQAAQLEGQGWRNAGTGLSALGSLAGLGSMMSAFGVAGAGTGAAADNTVPTSYSPISTSNQMRGMFPTTTLPTGGAVSAPRFNFLTPISGLSTMGR